MTFFLPPARGGAELLKFGAVEAVEDAQDVQVGMLRLKIACSRRAVKNNGLQIRADRRFQPFDKLCQIFFHEFLSVSLPTSARAATTRRAAAKSAEATAATESATTPTPPPPQSSFPLPVSRAAPKKTKCTRDQMNNHDDHTEE